MQEIQPRIIKTFLRSVLRSSLISNCCNTFRLAIPDQTPERPANRQAETKPDNETLPVPKPILRAITLTHHDTACRILAPCVTRKKQRILNFQRLAGSAKNRKPVKSHQVKTSKPLKILTFNRTRQPVSPSLTQNVRKKENRQKRGQHLSFRFCRCTCRQRGSCIEQTSDPGLAPAARSGSDPPSRYGIFN